MILWSYAQLQVRASFDNFSVHCGTMGELFTHQRKLIRGLSILDHNTETQNKGYSMKCYVACVFVSALDVKWFLVKHYQSREKPDLVYAHLRCYLACRVTALRSSSLLTCRIRLLCQFTVFGSFSSINQE